MSSDIIYRYNQLVMEAKESKKELAIVKLKEALKIFEQYKSYFGEGNESLDVELKEMMGEWENGKGWIENNEDWGKEYYEDGSLKAEWSNQNFMKFGKYIGYHRNGKISMTVNYIDAIHRDGLMHKYFENGEISELWSYNDGKRVFVKKYYENGVLKTEWLYDVNGKEISKTFYDESGNLLKIK